MSQLKAAVSSLRRFAMLLAAITLACIGLGIGIGLGLSVSGVLATHDDPAIIHACVDRVSRLARIVEDPNDCTRYERLVEWQSGSGVINLEARLSALETELATLQAQVPDCLRTASESDPNTIAGDAIFEGCNVHVRNGMNETDTTNERGNLIIGYNEESTEGDLRDGSHNLVVGLFHSYSSYSGMVVGSDNTISGAFASISGGQRNTASGQDSSVSGGLANTAGGNFSSVVGGTQGVISTAYDTVIGDTDGEATFDSSSRSLVFDDDFMP